MTDQITLKITSAIAIDGTIHKAGAIVEVPESVAKNFLQRGKAVLATEADAPAAADPVAETKPLTKAEKKAAEAAAKAEADAAAKALTEANKTEADAAAKALTEANKTEADAPAA